MDLAVIVGQLLGPVLLAGDDRAHLYRLLHQLAAATEVDDKLLARFGDLTKVAELREIAVLVAALNDPDDPREPGDIVGALIPLTDAVLDAIRSLAALAGSRVDDLVAPMNSPTTWADLAELLPGYLLGRFLTDQHPVLGAVLGLLGMLRTIKLPDSDSYELLELDEVGDLLGDPVGHVRGTYRWGADFDYDGLLGRIEALAGATGCAVTRRVRDDGFDVLDMVIVDGAPRDGGDGRLALEIAPALDGVTPDGIAIGVGMIGAIGSAGLGPDWSLATESDLNGASVELRADGVTTTGPVPAISFIGKPATPWTLFGSATGTHLEVDGATVTLAAEGEDAQISVRLGAEVDGGLRLLIGGDDVDSFLANLLGATVEIDTGPTITWSMRDGVTFGGSATFEMVIVVERGIGPVWIHRLTIALGFVDGVVALLVTAAASADVGPFTAAVDGLGLRAALVPAVDGTGTFGTHDLVVGFQPPHGVGLGIDADVVTGGGYLYFDPEKGEYAGAGDLAMLGVGITTIGLLATRLPDGSEGWSMFLSLSVTFTGLQLGFGFTLNGLGGLVGVNRGLDDEALANGVRTGALDGMLFPENPIADAPRILADLDAVFPSVVGQFVFGPVVKIGWGTPTLITLDLGIVIQLPEPMTVSLLGSLEALLPTKDAAVIELRLDVAGTLNITEGTLKIDASLRDSRVLTLELTGDLAVRASFLDNPTFLVAFGGFHPDFLAPADFPELALLAIALDTGPELRIQLGGYFALTSNTVQFGAEFSLWVKALGFTAEGGTTFDALVYFAPFGFAIDLHLWVSVKAGSFDLLGVELVGVLTGPNPWYVASSATFKLLGVKQSLDVEATVGDREADAPKEVVYVEELLIAALQLSDAWLALPPTGDGEAVVLGDGDSDARQVHPAGRIEVRQRIVPLDTRIDHYGNASLGGADSFELTAPRVGTQPVAASDSEDVQDFFAAAQFFELAEDEKLSAPSFEQMKAGIRLGDAGIDAGRAAEMTFDHEVVYRDPNVRSADRATPGTLFVATQTALSRAVSLGASLGARTAARLPRSTKAVGGFAVQPVTFVALKTDMGVVASGLTPAAGTSFFAARDSVMGAKNRNRAVVPAYVLELLG